VTPKHVLVALVAIVALTVPASTSAAGPATIALISITTSSTATDRAPKGPSRGDRYVTTSRLVNARRQFGARKGTVVGSDRGTITLTGPRSARVNVVATLPGGTIRVRGPLDEQTNATLVVPVVGGTGAFAGARGTLTINGTEKRAWNVYRLTYGSG
jgi:hypothetical protein